LSEFTTTNDSVIIVAILTLRKALICPVSYLMRSNTKVNNKLLELELIAK